MIIRKGSSAGQVGRTIRTSAVRAGNSTVGRTALRLVTRTRTAHNIVIFASPSCPNNGVQTAVIRQVPNIGRTFLHGSSTRSPGKKDLKVRRTSPRGVETTLGGICARERIRADSVSEGFLSR